MTDKVFCRPDQKIVFLKQKGRIVSIEFRLPNVESADKVYDSIRQDIIDDKVKITISSTTEAKQ